MIVVLVMMVRMSHLYYTILFAGSDKPGFSIDQERAVQGETSGACVTFNPYCNFSIEQQRQKLPVFRVGERYMLTLQILVITYNRLTTVYLNQSNFDTVYKAILGKPLRDKTENI